MLPYKQITAHGFRIFTVFQADVVRYIYFNF
jgi:hypothetical protein